MRKYRLIALLMALILIADIGSTLFVQADAAEIGTSVYNGKVFSTPGDSISAFAGYTPASVQAQDKSGVVLNKNAFLENNGTYSINLSAFTTGKTTSSIVTSRIPLDVVLVLDSSSSMLEYRKEYLQVTIRDKVQAYPSGTTKSTNLVTVLNSAPYYHNGTEWAIQSTASTSYTFPVLPGDKIRCSSFKQIDTRKGIRVTFFDNDGNVLESWSGSKVFDNNSSNDYIVVPKGAAAMSVPLWNVDTERYIYNLSLSGTKVYPATTVSFINKVQAYPSGVTKDTNLLDVLESLPYYYNGTKWTIQATASTSYTFPVQPMDEIECSSFNENGTNRNGIRVTFFDKDGNVLESWSPEKVYEENSRPTKTGAPRNFIMVPDGAVAMNVPIWNTDEDEGAPFLYNHKVKEKNGYNPVTEEQMASLRVKLLQEQMATFAETLRADAAEHGLEHKLSIVTFGGGNVSTDTVYQGYYERHVSVNGFNNYYFTNTGLFVNGQFKNYVDSERVTSVKQPSYSPIFASDLNKNATYYYLVEGRQDDITKQHPQQRQTGYVGTINYTNGQWLGTYTTTTGQTITVPVTPRKSPYDSNDTVLFLTKTETAPSMLTNQDYKEAMTSVLGSNGKLSSDLQFAIDRIVARGSTNTMYGLEMAYNILKQNPARPFTDVVGQEYKSQQVVILFTDGESNNDEDGTYNTIFTHANAIKDAGAKVYTVGVTITGTKAAKWLDRVSSNYGQSDINSDTPVASGYYFSIEEMSGLESIFQSISGNLITSDTDVSLDENAVMQDVLGEGLILPDDFGFENIAVSTVDITTADGIQFTEGTETKFTYNTKTGFYTDGTINLTVSYDKSTGTISVSGFDYAENHVTSVHPGKKLVVKITGVEATRDAVTDTVIDTNKNTSGIVYVATNGTHGLYPFEVPKTILANKTYVVDYARPMTIDPTEWSKSLLGIVSQERLNLATPADEIRTSYGTFTKNANGSLTFTPTTMQWNDAATIYALGTMDTIPAGVTTGENLWTRVNVIPANNVYYEDTFVTNVNTGVAGIIYSSIWKERNEADATPEGDGAGENAENSEDEDHGGVHGWEDNLADDTGYSDGSAHVSSTTGASATFTFTGTGVDIYSRTNSKSGIVIAMLYEGNSTTDKNGKNLVAKYTLMVDNLAASGDYFQVPTLSLCKIPAKDGNGNIVKDQDGNTVMVDMPHGTYTVKIIVSKASDSQTGKERFTYYLDGIRVYNPIQNLEGSDTVSDAYGEAELNANFVKIRDKLLDANSFSADDKTSAGPVFIDRITSEDGKHTDKTNSAEIGIYEQFGPKNEVYLSAGQMISFAVEYSAGAHYYIGLKSLTGVAVDAVINSAQTSINHSTDLYYEVTPAWTDKNGNPYKDVNGQPIGIITIMAESSESAILALTKLKVTGSDAATFKFAAVRNSLLLSHATDVANTDVSDAENPGTPDVEVENPETEPPEKDDKPENEWMYSIIKLLYARLRRWFLP